MLVLGVHGTNRIREGEDSDDVFVHHDAAAALVENGHILAAVEEERLNRIKHFGGFPVQAIRSCLAVRNVDLQEVDLIVVDESEEFLNKVAGQHVLEDAEVRLRTGRERIADLFAREFGVDVATKIRFCGHHRAHLSSAFYPSGFDRALVVSIDAWGEHLSGVVALGEAGRLTELAEYGINQSIGELYVESIKVLGYRRFDEYKVMGLAPYGNPKTFRNVIARCYRLLPKGDYEIEPAHLRTELLTEAGLIALARRTGEPFSQQHKDFAAALQEALEEIVLHVLGHFAQATGERSLCLAGGVAHNCSMNGAILTSGGFDRVFVQPAAHDAGNAVGAALALDAEARRPLRHEAMTHIYLGPSVGDRDAIRMELQKWETLLAVELCPDITARTARLLADGAVVGWVQGRSEFGPRALGNRSILADARPVANRDRVNGMVKKREAYRPFAPSVPQERLGDFFVVPPSEANLGFMVFVTRVHETVRELLGAVTHVDGSARVHAVARDVNPRYWSLLDTFGALTGVPVLLNTSFNRNIEPIVDSVHDAVTCFLTTDLDWLIIEDFLISRRQPASFDKLIPRLRPSRKLVAVGSPYEGSTHIFRLESISNRWFSEPVQELSENAFRVLLAADGLQTIHELLSRVNAISEGSLVVKELLRLWEARAIVLAPRC